MKKPITVGMSGGVDSSVAAWLLCQAGYNVTGVFMKNWNEDDNDTYCSATEDEADARTVCDKLKIPLLTVNFAEEYWDRVFEYFLAELRCNRTPNPDILCNQEIKFNAFLDYALKNGATGIATGHYARIERINDRVKLCKATDSNKDQTYFLHRLNQHQLQHTLFPLSAYPKHEIRRIAAEQGFINHNKKDSTGICFIGERNFNDFISQYMLAKAGPIQTPEGKVIGQHRGLMYYTIGQRKGIDIGGLRESSGEPWYVAVKDASNNALIIVQGHDHPALFKSELQCSNIHWIAGTAPELPMDCMAKLRHRQPDQACSVTVSDNSEVLNVTFTMPQRAITPGQSVVFYNDDVCLGGAVILC